MSGGRGSGRRSAAGRASSGAGVPAGGGPLADRDHDPGTAVGAVRAVRSRWSRTGRGARWGRADALGGKWLIVLTVRDLPVRLTGMFACRLSCPGCSQGTIARGSRRTLEMALRLMIEESESGSPEGDPADRSRPRKIPSASVSPDPEWAS